MQNPQDEIIFFFFCIMIITRFRVMCPPPPLRKKVEKIKGIKGKEDIHRITQKKRRRLFFQDTRFIFTKRLRYFIQCYNKLPQKYFTTIVLKTRYFYVAINVELCNLYTKLYTLFLM